MTKESPIRIFAFSTLLLLSGCDEDSCLWNADQSLVQQYLMQCVSSVSKQPIQNHEDNNGHIVAECQEAAQSNARRWMCINGKTHKWYTP